MATARRRPPARKPATQAAAAEGGIPETPDTGEGSPVYEADEIPADAIPQGEQMSAPTEEFTDLRVAFVQSLNSVASQQLDYMDLLNALHAEGWFIQLREQHSMVSPTGNTLVSFAILFGLNAGELLVADQISFNVPAQIAVPSMWARNAAYPSVVMALFNRAPPQVAMEPAPERPEPYPSPEAAGGEWEPLELVERRSADGLPIFYDPFALSEDPDDVVNSFVAILMREVPEVQSLAGLSALYEINQNMFEYVKETQPKQYDMVLSDILRPRQAELEELEMPVPRQAPRTGRQPARRG